MATHTVLAREDRGALIALGTHGGVLGALGPCFVVVPNVTPSPPSDPSVSPIAVLFGTASVSGGMFPETKVEQHGSLDGREKQLTSFRRRRVLDGHSPSTCTVCGL